MLVGRVDAVAAELTLGVSLVDVRVVLDVWLVNVGELLSELLVTRLERDKLPELTVDLPELPEPTLADLLDALTLPTSVAVANTCTLLLDDPHTK